MRKCIFLLLGLVAWQLQLLAQSRTITGTVRDNNGEPLANVSIKVVGERSATISGEDGSFSFTVPANARNLEVSYVGYATQTVAIPSGGSLVVVLNPSGNTNMDEVIVTGYTREKRSNFAGAVSKVNARAINQVPVASIDQILQGRAPGLYIAAGSGQPGSAATAIIRGVGTISGSSAPLYVIDGIPVSAQAFSGLSASDIESVDVLKDASSTSLYGSRGANGVIVITTKRGRAGNRLVFGVKTQAGFSDRTREKFEMMNSQQRIQFEEQIGIETGQEIGPGWTYSRNNPDNASLPAAELARYDRILDSLSNMNVDWRDIFFRTGSFQEHEVNASGGSDKVSFYSSLNYLKQNGIAIRSGLERYSLRNNVDFRTDKFTAALSSTLNYSQSSFIENENTTAVTNPFASVYYALPYEQPYINGVLVHPGNVANYNVLDLREGSTALERALATTSKRNEMKAVLGGNFRYSLTKNLALMSTLGLDFRELMSERFVDPNSYTGTLAAGQQGSFAETVSRIVRLFGNGGINFNKTFAERHLLDITALYEAINTTPRQFGYTGFGINPLLPGTPAGITPGSATGGFIPTVGGTRDNTGVQNILKGSLQSAIAIARYVYDDKYTLNASYRLDGSSAVPEQNRWKGFYSFGGSWNMHREAFLEDASFVTNLQLRASYGVTASPFSSSFGYLATYASSRYNGETGVSLSQVPNTSFDWEYAKTGNIGVDFTLFGRKLSGSLDVYNKNTENLFVSQELSRTSGTSTLEINAGEMRNRGIELALSSDVVSTKDLRVTLGANAAYNQNEITNLGQVNEFEQGTSIIRVGLPYGSHYLPRWAGVDAATGSPLYYNKDGSVTNIYNRSTQSVAEMGSYLPKAQGGFNGGLNYKGFYLEAFFSFATGIKRFNNEDFFNETPSFATSNQSTRVLTRWRKPGDVTDIQRFTSARSFSSKDIQDASFIRFRNLNIGYQVPAALVQKLSGKLSAITFFAQGQNLYTWTQWRGFDPEDNNNISTFEYPNQRTITFGLNVSF